MAKRKKPPLMPAGLYPDPDVEAPENQLFSRGKAQEIWNWAWNNAKDGVWSVSMSRQDIAGDVSREFFGSGPVDHPSVEFGTHIAQVAVSSQKRDKILNQNLPPRGGFTYGYQWLDEQPPDLLRFPMEFGDVRVYPVGDAKFLAEFTTEPDRWRRATLDELVEGGADGTRIAVALDWHAENGVSLNPFVATEWMSPRLNVTFASNPAAWMNDAVDEWIRRWESIGEMWWLDTRITSREQWNSIYEAYGRSYERYEVRSLDVWGNARDGYEVNNSFRVGEVVVPEDGDVIQVLVDAGHLNDGRDLEIEDQFDFIEILGPEIAVEMPERMEPEGSLPKSFADEVWQWAFEATVDQEFGERRGEDGPPIEHIDVRNHWPYTAWEEIVGDVKPKKKREGLVEEAMDDAFRIAQAAVAAALEATRNESRIPLLQLQHIEED